MSSRNRVFIGRLPKDISHRHLEKWLDGFGFRCIDKVQLKNGYAFVDFRDYRDALDCVKEMDRREFFGSRVTVEMAHGNRSERPRSRDRDRYNGRNNSRHNSRSGYRDRNTYQNGYYREKYGAPYNTDYRVVIENLSSRAGWQEVKDFFRQSGTVTYAECHRHKSGVGAVEFANREDMERALSKYNGELFMGRNIKLYECPQSSRDNDGRSPQRGGSHRDYDIKRRRSRSYSRERSRSHSNIN